jgi:hypothetical protein
MLIFRLLIEFLFLQPTRQPRHHFQKLPNSNHNLFSVLHYRFLHHLLSQSIAVMSSVSKLSVSDYEKQAQEYTAKMLQELNEQVRDDPTIASKSQYFQSEENILKGLPIFTGTRSTFVYDENDELVDTIVQQKPVSAADGDSDEDHDAVSANEENDWHEEEWEEEDEYAGETDNVWAETAGELDGSSAEEVGSACAELSAGMDAMSMNTHVRFGE